MGTRELTCAAVQERDMEARYLAGTLPPEEAEAFEAHYFGCERCWTAVQRALDVRAAETGAADAQAGHAPPAVVQNSAPGVVPLQSRNVRARRWWPVAAAASIMFGAVAIWQADGRGNAGLTETVRGEVDSLPVTTRADADSVFASWRPSRGGDRYRVRLLTAGGALLMERETAATTVSVAIDSLMRAAPRSVIYWDVQALDALRRVVARSGPRSLQLPVESF